MSNVNSTDTTLNKKPYEPKTTLLDKFNAAIINIIIGIMVLYSIAIFVICILSLAGVDGIANYDTWPDGTIHKNGIDTTVMKYWGISFGVLLGVTVGVDAIVNVTEKIVTAVKSKK
jgi:uncharacterized membrane protein